MTLAPLSRKGLFPVYALLLMDIVLKKPCAEAYPAPKNGTINRESFMTMTVKNQERKRGCCRPKVACETLLRVSVVKMLEHPGHEVEKRCSIVPRGPSLAE